MHTVDGLLATAARLAADSPILRGFQAALPATESHP
jgi:hypothetical protein